MPIAMNIAAADSSAVAANSEAPSPIPTFAEPSAAAVSRAVGIHVATKPTPSPAAAWIAAPALVVCPDRNSSQRPASSSPRKERVVTSRPQIAPRIITVMPDL
jgi:hypothetical protein